MQAWAARAASAASEEVNDINLMHWTPAEDGPLSETALRKKLERLGYTVTRYVYQPGAFFPNHSHGIDKMDAVVSGRFRLVVEGQEVIMEAGDILAVPRGTVHSAEVVGDQPVVSLDGIKASIRH